MTDTVAFEVEDRIAWVRFNRPDKRNAMSPTLNREMVEVLEVLEQATDRVPRNLEALYQRGRLLTRGGGVSASARPLGLAAGVAANRSRRRPTGMPASSSPKVRAVAGLRIDMLRSAAATSSKAAFKAACPIATTSRTVVTPERRLANSCS